MKKKYFLINYRVIHSIEISVPGLAYVRDLIPFISAWLDQVVPRGVQDFPDDPVIFSKLS